METMSPYPSKINRDPTTFILSVGCWGLNQKFNNLVTNGITAQVKRPQLTRLFTNILWAGDQSSITWKWENSSVSSMTVG